ncbi:MAG: M1 family metallopeptidase [Proteobacteria bacterium]|nr:M1 family metallopeptidase [Pseudomonadota bacterium]
MHRIALLPAFALLLTAAPAFAVTPEQVVETATRLDSRALNNKRSFPADGQVLERPGMTATFEDGRFFPIERNDGRVIGLIFDGLGTAVYTVEGQLLERPFGAGHLRFSDSTLDDLQGEREWAEDSDPSGASFRLFEARTALLEDTLWTRDAPHLVIDQLIDLFGGGHVGGHLYADFRIAGGATWTTYLHNPRGGLISGETTTIFTANPLGARPPELDVLASFGSSSEVGTGYDVTEVALDVWFPTSGPMNNRNLMDAAIVADIDLVATRADRTLRAVVFELESERAICIGQSDLDRIKITRVTDGDDNALAAVHRKNRVIIPLDKPLQPGESVHLTIEYSGPMTQGIPVQGRPDTFFTPLGPWAWYPRNLSLDRFGSRVEAHIPRFFSAVAPGDLKELRKEKEGWHFVYEEPSGVKTLSLVVGDMIHTPEDQQGTNPRIIVWLPAGSEKEIRGSATPVRGMLDFIASIWGTYPYTTLHVVENVAYPANNWGNSNSSWDCVPPSQTHPWQGWMEGPTGMVLSNSPVTTPAQSVRESAVYDRLMITPIESTKYTRVVDLTRQWWGHMIPSAGPRHTWIGEALAQWTGLIFTRAAVGEGAMKERLNLMQQEMIGWAPQARPLGYGSLMGDGFPAQAWGKGPLVINWLINRLDGPAFKTTMTTLINRASSRGLSEELLLEVVGAMSDSSVTDTLTTAIHSNALPHVRWNTIIDKEAGEVIVILEQEADTFIPVDIPVQLIRGLTAKETKIARMYQPTVVMRWKPEDMPKRVAMDPLHLALAASLKKDKDLAPPPAAPEEPTE